jgi:hypothetical protein
LNSHLRMADIPTGNGNSYLILLPPPMKAEAARCAKGCSLFFAMGSIPPREHPSPSPSTWVWLHTPEVHH